MLFTAFVPKNINYCFSCTKMFKQICRPTFDLEISVLWIETCFFNDFVSFLNSSWTKLYVYIISHYTASVSDEFMTPFSMEDFLGRVPITLSNWWIFHWCHCVGCFSIHFIFVPFLLYDSFHMKYGAFAINCVIGAL